VDLVFKDYYRGFGVPVNAEVVRAAQLHVVAVAAVEVDDVLPSFDPPGVARHGDYVLEDHVLAQQVEVVLTVGQPLQPLSDDPEKRAVRPERGVVADALAHFASAVQARALRSANARKVAGLRPVTFRMSSVGVEPWPAMMAPVSQRSITA
jgi:hypothetical protein